MRVVQSPTPSLVCVEGIVLAETKRTLVLMCSERERCVQAPKSGAVFELLLPTGCAAASVRLNGKDLI